MVQVAQQAQRPGVVRPGAQPGHQQGRQLTDLGAVEELRRVQGVVHRVPSRDHRALSGYQPAAEDLDHLLHGPVVVGQPRALETLLRRPEDQVLGLLTLYGAQRNILCTG